MKWVPLIMSLLLFWKEPKLLIKMYDKQMTLPFCEKQAKIREVASLEGHVLLKKLRDALEYLRGLLAGRNKEDVEEAISMVSCS